MTSMQTKLLKTSTVLWVIWGIVHLLAGIIILTSDATGAVQAVADAVDPEALVNDYHAAVGGLLNQHGWNLAWIGLVTFIGGIFIWRGNMTAIWVTAMIGGLTDIGYFIFMDLGGFVNFMPGTVMTLVSATAIILSGWVWFSNHSRT